ncbi:5575_t:CDS:1, partial [Scutellospora calospora]
TYNPFAINSGEEIEFNNISLSTPDFSAKVIPSDNNSPASKTNKFQISLNLAVFFKSSVKYLTCYIE